MSSATAVPVRRTAILPRTALSVAAVLVCGGLCLGIYALCGANLFAGFRVYLCLLVYLLAPGWLVAHRLVPDKPGLRPLCALLCGCALLLVCYLGAMVLHQPLILRLGPPVLLCVLLWLRGGLTGVRCTARDVLSGLVGLFTRHRALLVLWAVLCVFSALSFSSVNPHPAAAGAVSLDRDFLWNVGNAEAFCKAFPAQDIRFAGVRFSYHYLTELLTAALSLVSGASCYDLFAFFLPPVWLAGEIAALYWLGLVICKESTKASCIPFVLFCFQCGSLWKVFRTGDSIFGNTMLRHLTSNINAQASAVVFFSIFLGLFACLAKARFGGGVRLWGLCLVAFALFAVAKGPEAILALCACAAAMVFVLLFQKPRYPLAVLFLALLAGLFAMIYNILYAAGANTSMQFSIFCLRNTLTYARLEPLADWLCTHLPISGYVWLVLIGVIDTFFFCPFQFCLWGRSLPGALRHLPRLDAAHLLLHAGTVGGFLAYHLFSHESSSQVYFALFAMLCMSILAAEQLPGLRRTKFPPLITLAAGAAGLLTALCMVLSLSGRGLSVLSQLPDGGLYTPSAVTAGDEEAGQWLRENAPAGTVFLTNRTSGLPTPDLDGQDGISNVYTAFSGVQCYMEGWTYAMSNMGVPADMVEHRRAVVDKVFDAHTPATDLPPLCREEGVTCLVWAKRWPGSAPAGQTPAFENADVAIYWVG